MERVITCWQCGKAVADLALPLGRHAECPRCRADLRVCRLCTFYDQRASNACREPQAEPVREKERANFCDDFRPRTGAEVSGTAAAEKARSGLDALFGASGSPESQPAAESKAALEQLFGKKKER